MAVAPTAGANSASQARHVAQDGYGSKGEILAPSICFPLYPSTGHHPAARSAAEPTNTGDIPFTVLKLVLIQPHETIHAEATAGKCR
jgi:hypothetical protein